MAEDPIPEPGEPRLSDVAERFMRLVRVGSQSDP